MLQLQLHQKEKTTTIIKLTYDIYSLSAFVTAYASYTEINVLYTTSKTLIFTNSAII